ncbi:putative holin-like toxin [Sporosarcina sp. FA15]
MMVTFEAMNMLFQFGIFLAAALTAVVAIIVAIVITNQKKVTAHYLSRG